MDRPPNPRPGEPWSLAAAEAMHRAHDCDASAAMLELEARMRTAHPEARVFVYRYDAAGMFQQNRRRDERTGVCLGFVQVRTAIGNIISGTVSVRWDTGCVEIKGWSD